MSIKIMSMVWSSTAGATPSARLVLLALADAASDDGICWPSLRTLATKAGVSESTARAVIAGMEEQGLVTRHARRRGASQTSNLYEIDVAVLRSMIPTETEPTPLTVESHPPQDPAPNRKKNHQENQGTPPGGAALAPVQPPPVEKPGADKVVAAYVDAFRRESGGADPVRSVIAQVGREAKRLLETHDFEAVQLAAEALGGTPFRSLEAQMQRAMVGVNRDRDKPTPGQVASEIADDWRRQQEAEPGRFSTPLEPLPRFDGLAF